MKTSDEYMEQAEEIASRFGAGPTRAWIVLSLAGLALAKEFLRNRYGLGEEYKDDHHG